ncbi:methionine--tRNA ligase [Patescibacteria group bacterium]
MQDNFYITTTLPYVNADPHLGHALEFIQADVIARYKKINGEEVFFNIGTDEHGQKIFKTAEEEDIDTREFCDKYAARFEKLAKNLNISYTNFIRTNDEHHIKAAQEFWRRCFNNGDIYKKNYKVKYCVGCELEKTDSELEDGKCPLHPNKEIELIEEENYFFKFSKYQDKLLELYNKNSDFVLPKEKMNEIKSFTENGLQDFSISRLKSKMPWGVEVPDDPDHIMYVWFDALVNYISAIGWPDDMDKFNKWWPAFQVAGKDNLRQQTSMWQAMLMSAGIKPSKQVLIHGFIGCDGQKMSKSLGNVIDPFEIANKYGVDALRYYLLAEIPTMKDGDFSIEKFEIRYNADLANGIGNLVSRTITMILKLKNQFGASPLNKGGIKGGYWEEYIEKMDNMLLNEALAVVNKLIKECDGYIAETKPWEMIKNGDNEKAGGILLAVSEAIRHIAWMLKPFMPETADKIFDILNIADTESGKTLEEARKWGSVEFKEFKKADGLFPRI